MPQPPCPAPAEPVQTGLVALADRCVQCALCLPACPTYGLDRTEAESPRGRIALARALALGTLAPTGTVERHLDQCLGCRSCEAVCPAGVRYGELLVAARATQRQRRPPAWHQRAIGWLAAHPWLLQRGLDLYRRAFPVLPPRLRPLPRPERPPAAVAQGGAPSPVAALFTGCIAPAYEAGLHDALARLCGAVGVHLQVPPGQTCCGALHAHAGDTGSAARLARRNRAAFSGAGTVLTLASGCHEAVAGALPVTAVATDAIAFLHERAAGLAFRECREHVALHLPCTQRNVVKSAGALRGLLARVPGLRVTELPAGHGCCGAAGTQMLLAPERADLFRQPLIEAFERSGATRLLSANIGCRLHLGNATASPVQHPLEFLAALATPAA